MRLKKKVLLLIGLALFFFISEPAAASGGTFSVKPLVPANQLEGVSSYFDLTVNPSDSQQLEVELTNLSEKEITIEIDIASATTTDGGSVQYGPSQREKDDSLRYDMKDLVEYEKEVTLAPKTTVIYPIKLTVPTESFDGILLGGIEFKEKDQGKEPNANKEQLQLVNKYAYEVAIQLKETETEVPAELKLLRVKADQVNYRNTVKATLQNTQPSPVTDLVVTGKVFRAKSNRVIYEQTATAMTMAPNSHFDFGIPWGKEAFSSGGYRLELTAKAKEGEWTFTKDFTITAEEAKKLNEQAIDVEKSQVWPYVLLVIVAIIVVGIVVYLVTKRRTQVKLTSKKGKSRKKSISRKKHKK